jgi:ABC-type antimicrobial peptide transport system permease subunit
MDQVLSGPLSRPRLETFLLSAFGLVALLLAAVGLYGVTTFLVRQQTRELGVRIALGASPRRILGLTLVDALRVALVGALAGVALSLVMARLLAAHLFEVSPGDPVALVGAGSVLLVVVCAAALVPALRAARIDPIEALRTD